jgi:hypothetical protein
MENKKFEHDTLLGFLSSHEGMMISGLSDEDAGRIIKAMWFYNEFGDTKEYDETEIWEKILGGKVLLQTLVNNYVSV